MVYVRGCCCWRNTKDGSVACGYFTLFTRLIGTALVIVGLVNLTSLATYIHGSQNYISSLRLLFVAQLIDCLVFIVFSAMLIHGVKTDNTVMMFPWIVWMVIEIGSLIILLILTFIGVTQGLLVSAVVFSVLISVVFLGIDIYTLMCVTSQYRLLQHGPPSYSVIA
uniref:Venom protein AbVp-1 n=1 Tax=Androctonus bicolor TaxID=748906 RepID=A0A0K0LCD3_9SCOR|nr:venom protein AbVp-1 [Androctonus bicolor]